MISVTAPRPLKLQSIADGRLYATSYRTVYREAEPGSFRAVGQLPVPKSERIDPRYRFKTTYPWKPALERVVGRFPTVNVWTTSTGVHVGSAVRWLFVSTNGGRTWHVTHQLPASSGPMGVLPTAFCEHEGQLYVGEYPLDNDETPRVLRSEDWGRTWDPVLSLPDVRHVHALESDPYGGDLWITTGDAGDECRIGRLRDGRLDTIGSGSQRWRAVEPVFTPAGVLWGVDSVYTESNELHLLRRDSFDRAADAVETVATVDNSVYYGTSFTVDGDHWVVFSTAYEPGADSTAPEEEQVITKAPATVVASSSSSGYERWHQVATYEKRPRVSDHDLVTDVVPSAAAYVFLAADDDRGLFVNPYNTVRHEGSVRNYSPSYFADLN